MTEGGFPPLRARPYRDAADRAQWEKVFLVLRVEDETEREALRAKLESWVDHYANARGFHRDDGRAGRWRDKALHHTSALVKLLKSAPFPFDEDPLFDYLDPDVPGKALAMLARIEAALLPNEPPSPRPPHRPKADYSDLEELVARVAPIYRDRTNKNPAATPGPFTRLMRALVIIAGERPVDHAIRTAIRAYVGESNRR